MSITKRDGFWLALCGVSLVCYVLRSETVRAFTREVLRLVTKFW